MSSYGHIRDLKTKDFSETKINNGELIPVPEKTFAEAMLEICLQAVNNTSEN